MTKVSFINIFLKPLHFVERLILALIVLSSRLKVESFHVFMNEPQEIGIIRKLSN